MEYNTLKDAIIECNKDGINKILASGADMYNEFAYEGYYRQPFVSAFIEGGKIFTDLFIKNGYDIVRGNVLYEAIEFNLEELVKVLINDYKYKITDISFIKKVFNSLFFINDDMKINKMINIGLFIVENMDLINIKEFIEIIPNIIDEKNINLAMELFNKVEDINEQDENGDTILHNILKYSGQELLAIEILKYPSININIKNNYDESIFYIAACKATNKEIFLKILAKGANINEYSEDDDNSLLHSAVNCTNESAILFFIKNGIDINRMNRSGATPLILLAEKEKWFNYDIAEILLENGANINLKNNDGNSALHYLVRDKIENVELLLKYDADVNIVNNDNETPILTAVLYGGKQEVIELLIRYKADINIANNSGKTPLFYAIEKNNLDIAKILILAGADATIKDLEGNSAYKLALINNYKNIYSLIEKNIIQNKTDDNNIEELFMRACKNGNFGVVEMLISKNNLDITYVDDDGRTPLHYVARIGKVSIGEFLIKQGININYRDKFEQTALHFATSARQKNMVELLIKNGADLEAKDKDGITPIHFIVNRGQDDILKTVIEAGISSEYMTNKGESLLHAACYTNSKGCVKVLLEKDANPNITDNNGETPLMAAVKNNQKEITSILINAGAEIDTTNKFGNNVLHISTENGYKDMVELLLKQGIFVNNQNNNGETPLFISAENGYKDIFELLLASGADFDIKNNEGLSVLDLAAKNNQKELIEIINIYKMRREILNS